MRFYVRREHQYLGSLSDNNLKFELPGQLPTVLAKVS